MLVRGRALQAAADTYRRQGRQRNPAAYPARRTRTVWTHRRHLPVRGTVALRRPPTAQVARNGSAARPAKLAGRRATRRWTKRPSRGDNICPVRSACRLWLAACRWPWPAPPAAPHISRAVPVRGRACTMGPCAAKSWQLDEMRVQTLICLSILSIAKAVWKEPQGLATDGL